MSAACVASRPPTVRLAVSPGIAAVGLVAAGFALNLVYLAGFCPHDLAPDEAHYWDWSRHPDWAYYSKGPLVAWLIRASCTVFGDTAFGVRFPAAVCSTLLLLAVYRLAADLYSPRVGLIAVAVGLTLPPVSVGAVLMTIDAPLLACWGWAAVAVGRGRWAAAGTLCGVGVLAKYTMLLFPAGVGLWLLAAGRRPGRGFAVLAGLTLAGLLPILGWNATHGWVGFAHVTALGGLDDSKPASLRLLGPLEYIGTQAAVLVGFWLVAWVAAVRRPDRRAALLWWLSVPVWLLFLAASGAVKPQANWPLPAYVTGLPLVAGWLADRPQSWRPAGVAAVAGLLVGGFAHFPTAVRPTLAKMAGGPTADRPAPVRRLDPTCRLAGWRTLADAVDRLRTEVRAETGEAPLVAGMSWTLPGELGFYCDGQPQVYSFGPAVGERLSQYDVWRPNPAADAQAFQGRAFVYVGELNPRILGAFERVGPPVEVVASDGGVPVNRWTVRVCYGFRGFPTDSGTRRGF